MPSGFAGQGGSFGNSTFSAAGGAVSDLFAADAHRFKAQGNRIEGSMYREAAGLALQNEEFTKESTAVKLAQQERESYKIIGGQQADVAGSGFAASGTALDLLRDSSSQAALQNALMGRQGLITEAGYHQQADSYKSLAAASDVAVQAEEHAATGATWSAGIKGITAIATLA